MALIASTAHLHCGRFPSICIAPQHCAHHRPRSLTCVLVIRNRKATDAIKKVAIPWRHGMRREHARCEVKNPFHRSFHRSCPMARFSLRSDKELSQEHEENGLSTRNQQRRACLLDDSAHHHLNRVPFWFVAVLPRLGCRWVSSLVVSYFLVHVLSRNRTLNLQRPWPPQFSFDTTHCGLDQSSLFGEPDVDMGCATLTSAVSGGPFWCSLSTHRGFHNAEEKCQINQCSCLVFSSVTVAACTSTRARL